MSEKHKALRAEINREIRARAWQFDVEYALVWGSAYHKLHKRTGYRPPQGVKNKLDCVEAAGHLNTLLSVVHEMRRPSKRKPRQPRRGRW